MTIEDSSARKKRATPLSVASLGGLMLLALCVSCGGEDTTAPAVPAAPVAPPVATTPAAPGPALLVSQAWFKREGGTTKPQPAKLVIWRKSGDVWRSETLLDPESNVFHKAMPWRDGILTIGAEGAILKHWTRSDGLWTAKVLWKKSWGGQFDRLRDVELGDVTGDGKEDIVIATHDQGVVAVGEATETGFTFHEIDQKPDTFVHEIEIGDVDGDGKLEFYATPSDRNRASGESQPGGVRRYDWVDGKLVGREVAHWENTHAKEILVAKLNGKDTLFAVKEGHTVKEGSATKLLDPVTIVRLDPTDKAYTETPVATIDDHQTRFLVPGDVDGDGAVELIAAGYKSGLWLLEPNEDGTFTPSLIDKGSSGFEHATHVADIDGDGQLEIYVAADDQHQLRSYTWKDGSFVRDVVGEIPKSHLSWNLQDGTL